MSASAASTVADTTTFAPLPVEAPVNKQMTWEAIEHILPYTSELMQSKPVNEIFNEEASSFHSMDLETEKALLSTFSSDETEMEKALGGSGEYYKDSINLTDELLAIVNDEQRTAPQATMMSHTHQHGHTVPCNAAASPVLNQTTVSTYSGDISAGAETSSFPQPTPVSAPEDLSPLVTGAVSEFNFPRKVYRMLDDAENNSAYSEIVSWTDNGTNFTVHDKKQFVETILPIYFDMTQYASFRRQLNMYHFERRGNTTYTNEFFIRGCPDLLDKITRKSGTGSKGNKN
jgi:hypothetical protein